MEEFKYTPDEELKVHEEGAIRLLCRAFRSHENGLPEWCKNSSDQYVRQNTPPNKRIIVLLFSNKKGNKSGRIGCLDFGGMDSNSIEKKFRIWADPTAAGKEFISLDIQGGHGNGGKCYMTQMFGEYSYVHTVKDGKGNKYGVPVNSVQFGYIPSPERGKNYNVKDIKKELSDTLIDFGVKYNDLPLSAQESFDSAKALTLFLGVNPKDYEGKIPVTELIESICAHSQMISTIQLCKIFILVDGKKINQGQPLALPEITPIEGATEPRIIVIPETLRDPKFENSISTTEKGKYKQGTLILKTSDKSMRWQRKWRHTITFKAISGYIGFVDVPSLGVLSSYAEKIYGECSLDVLEELKQNDRTTLADSPLRRSVEKWIGQQIEAYAKEFELKDKRRIDKEEKNALSKMNEALDRWKNKFLKDMIESLWGPGKDGGPPPPPPPLPSGKASRLELMLTHNKAGVGVSLRPILKFYDSKNRRIRQAPYKWVSEDTNVAMVDDALDLINTFSFGETQIYAETLDGKIRSNPLTLQVVHIYDIKIVPDKLEVPLGSRSSLTAICTLKSGEQISDIYLVWTESNSKIARVSPAGSVFGYQIGETEVFAGDNHFLTHNPAIVKVVESDSGGPGSKSGRGFPRILISEIDKDPETGEDVVLTSEHPPVYQRVQDTDKNIWWINSASPFARIYLNKLKGYGVDSREWRIYFLERYLEVIVKIALYYEVQESKQLSFDNWTQRWDETAASMQQFASDSLANFIDSGILPQE
jgi:hypothetical protein